MKPRVLLTSFPQFGDHKENISKKVMSDFKSSGISGIAIETELLTCDEAGSRRVSELLNHGEEYDAIIQLGLAENRKEISFELWAHNYSNFTIADNSGRVVDEIIIEGGLEKYETTVSKHILDEEFEDDEDVVWSESAGQFVCNETIYRTLDSIGKLEKKIPAIFVHLPPESEISFSRQIEVISRLIKTLAIKPRLEVVGALLFNPERKILACRRPPQDVWAGWWEFPGGKIDEGESEKEALTREIKEELGINVTPKTKIASLEYEYEDRFVSLFIWDCGIVNPDSINQNEHDLILWLDESTLNTVKWLPADVP
ncbi:MAG: NUDIX domain-containing protein, partial [Euryarchaeota archaeon]